MTPAYEIVHIIQSSYRGLADKLARITGKSAVWWRSHGYEPRTSNPLANGNVSDAEKYITYLEQYEAAEPGAGRMLNNRIHAEMEMRFSEFDKSDQSDIHVALVEETSDVQKWLASKNFANATANELKRFEEECDENIEAIYAAKSRARAVRCRMRITKNVVDLREAVA